MSPADSALTGGNISQKNSHIAMNMPNVYQPGLRKNMSPPLTDYLIIICLTVVSYWKITLPILALLAGLLFYKRYLRSGALSCVIFLFVALAAWEFEHYMH